MTHVHSVLSLLSTYTKYIQPQDNAAKWRVVVHQFIILCVTCAYRPSIPIVSPYFTVHDVHTVYLSSLQLSKTTVWDVQTGLYCSVSDTQTTEKLHMEVGCWVRELCHGMELNQAVMYVYILYRVYMHYSFVCYYSILFALPHSAQLEGGQAHCDCENSVWRLECVCVCVYICVFRVQLEVL